MQPRFSIVVPTRMRHTTLPHTLRTCLQQSFTDYEIVVADNASLPATREAVEACRSEKIRYIHSAEALPMTVNWTRAIETARGEWILLLGDDDGLFPWSLERLDRLVSQHPVRSVRWEMAVYTWPCVGVADQRNRLQLPIESFVRVVDADARLAQMRRSPHSATVPLPYHGLVHRSLFADAAKTGPIFDGPCPDTFAGVLLASLSKQFLEIGTPMSLVGVSGKSNGLQGVIEDGSGATYRDFVALNSKAGIHFHHELPQVPMMSVIILDGLLRTRDRLDPQRHGFNLTPLAIAAHCLDGLWQTGADRRVFLEAIEQILPDAASLAALRSDRRYATACGTRPSAALPLGLHGAHVVLDGQRLGIENVAGGSELAAELLPHQDNSLSLAPTRAAVLEALREQLAPCGYDVSALQEGWRKSLAAWSSRKLHSLRKRLPWKPRKAA